MLTTIAAILGQVIAYLPQAIALGMDVTSIVEKAIAISQAPEATTPEQIAALQSQLDAEMVVLQTKTAALNTDPG